MCSFVLVFGTIDPSLPWTVSNPEKLAMFQYFFSEPTPGALTEAKHCLLSKEVLRKKNNC